MIISPLVILLKVYPARIAIFEFEGNASWSTHMDRITRRFEASQGMKIKAGDVHFVRSRGDLQPIQTT